MVGAEDSEVFRKRLLNEAGVAVLADIHFGARETLEESGYQFEPTALVGVYRWHLPYAPDAPEGVTFLRFTYAGDIVGHEAERKLDKEIVRALWLTPAELRAQSARHRSPLVQLCVDDYLAGRRYPLELVTHCE